MDLTTDWYGSAQQLTDTGQYNMDQTTDMGQHNMDQTTD